MARVRESVVALLVLAFLGAASAGNAKVVLGTLAGTVVDHKGSPVAGASVTIQTSDGQHPHATTTNAQGRFYFPELTRGLYDVRAYYNGLWSDWHRNTAVKTGKQTSVTLRLAPPADQSVVVPK